MRILNYTQETPASAWTITHNFGSKVAADTWVIIGAKKTKILPFKVTSVTDNILLIEFTVAYAGGARITASSVAPIVPGA